MPRWAVWATLFGAGVAYEVHEVMDDEAGYPLSRAVRTVSRVEHRVGRLAFLLGWGWFASWFAAHIVGDKMDGSRLHS